MVCSRDLHLWGALLQPQNHPQHGFPHLPPQNVLEKHLPVTGSLHWRHTPAASKAEREWGGETLIPISGGRILWRGEVGISWDHQGWTGCWQTRGSAGDAQSCASLVLPAVALLSVPCQLTPSQASALCSQHRLGSPDTPCGHPGTATRETAAVFHCWHHPFRNETPQVTLKPFPYSRNGKGLQETPAKPRHAHRNHSAQESPVSDSQKLKCDWNNEHGQ